MKKICISKDWRFSSPEHPEQINVDLTHDYSIGAIRNPKSAGGASNCFSTSICESFEIEFSLEHLKIIKNTK